jgi:D-alanine--poly(phosphoribitol) ligase subunit 1
VIPHQGVLSLMRWAQTSICRPGAERFANINPLHFDNAVFDLYCGLLSGATLVPIETSALPNPAHWVRALRDNGVTVLFAVPTLFQTLDRLKLLTPERLPGIRTFIFGGEGYAVEALRTFHRRFRGQARLINVYGPTETSCICSSLEIDDAALSSVRESFPSLGHMHPDFDFAVLDEEGRAVRPGEAGELWIGGPNVGLGYYNNPEETQRRFRQDPRQADYRSVWYRSGDLVRQDESERLWFMGRIDNQVKIRGHRIELEEIDLAVGGIPGISRAVAVTAPGLDGPELHVAFVAERAVPEAEIHEHCSARLPPYMRPARVRQLEALPQNANGKVDRKAVQAILHGDAP